MARWVTSVREELEALTAQAPRDPTDFRRPLTISCKCALCGELKRFLENPSEPEIDSAAQAIRSHLESQIRNDKLDVDCTTERRGSPRYAGLSQEQGVLQSQYDDL